MRGKRRRGIDITLKAGFDDSETELEATWLKVNIRKVFSSYCAQ